MKIKKPLHCTYYFCVIANCCLKKMNVERNTKPSQQAKNSTTKKIASYLLITCPCAQVCSFTSYLYYSKVIRWCIILEHDATLLKNNIPIQSYI